MAYRVHLNIGYYMLLAYTKRFQQCSVSLNTQRDNKIVENLRAILRSDDWDPHFGGIHQHSRYHIL